MYVFGFQLLLYLLVFSPLQIQKSYTWRHTSMHIAASSYLVYKSSLYFSSFETMMYCDKHDSTQTEGALSKINCKKFFEGSENIPTHPSIFQVAKPSSNQFTLINVLLNTSRLFLTIKKGTLQREQMSWQEQLEMLLHSVMKRRSSFFLSFVKQPCWSFYWEIF